MASVDADASGAASAETRLSVSMLAGAGSAVVSRVFTHPTDTIKARLQMQSTLEGGPVYRGTWHAIKSLAAAEGVPGFFRGFGAIIIGFVPAQAAYFGGYEVGKTLTAPLRNAGHGVAADMATGVFQQLVAGMLFTPVDVIKERLQVQTMMGGKFQYNSTWHAVSSIVQQRGVSGMLKGYWATNAVWLPWNAIYIASYEASKGRVAAALRQPEDAQLNTDGSEAKPLPAWAFPLCSAASTSLATITTHPADVVKTQLQVLSASSDGASLTATKIFKDHLRKQGVHGFMAGLTPRLLTLVPGNALAWFTFEEIKKRLL